MSVSNLKLLIHSLSVGGGGVVINAGLGLLITRALGPEGKGELAIAMAYFSLGTVLLVFGMRTGAVNRVTTGAHDVKTVKAEVLVLWFGHVVLLGLLIIFGAHLFPIDLALLVCAALAATSTSLLQILNFEQLLTKNITLINNLKLFQVLTHSSGIICLITFTALSPLLVMASLSITTLLVSLKLIRKALHDFPTRFRLAKSILRNYVWCTPYFYGAILIVGLQRADIQLMAYYLDKSQLGVYAAAQNVSELMYLLPTVVSPLLFSLSSRREIKLRQVVYLSYGFSIVIALIGFFLQGFAVKFLVLLLGEEFSEISKYFYLALISACIFMPVFSLMTYYGGQGLAGKSNVILVISLLFLIILLTSLVPIYGIFGAYAATILMGILANVLYLLLLPKAEV